MTCNKNLISRIRHDDSVRLTKREIFSVVEWFLPPTRYCIDCVDTCELADLREFALENPRFNQLINLFGTEDRRGFFNHKYGWVSPVGQYYSCGHSGHEIKSQMIIRANRDLMIGFLELFNNAADALVALTNATGVNNPSDFLLRKGWCRLQSIDDGEPIANIHETASLTKKQIDVIFFVTLKYKFLVDPVTKVRLQWTKLAAHS